MTEKVRKVGRPTKYNAGMIAKVHDYVDAKFGEKELPIIEEFCYLNDIDTDTSVEWCKKHKKFSVAIKRLKAVQSTMLQSGIFKNTGNVAGGIFLLKNNHGFKDRTETDVTSGGKPIPLLGGQSVIHPDNSNGKDTPANQKN